MSSLNVPNTKKSRLKVVLEPGHSPMDWAHLKSSSNLRTGFTGLRRIKMEEIQLHHKKDDAWIVIMGKVYDMTPYLNFHPGGIPLLMSVAGKDGTLQFQRYHSWVNADLLLDKCLLGYLEN